MASPWMSIAIVILSLVVQINTQAPRLPPPPTAGSSRRGGGRRKYPFPLEFLHNFCMKRDIPPRLTHILA